MKEKHTGMKLYTRELILTTKVWHISSFIFAVDTEMFRRITYQDIDHIMPEVGPLWDGQLKKLKISQLFYHFWLV